MGTDIYLLQVIKSSYFAQKFFIENVRYLVFVYQIYEIDNYFHQNQISYLCIFHSIEVFIEKYRVLIRISSDHK